MRKQSIFYHEMISPCHLKVVVHGHENLGVPQLNIKLSFTKSSVVSLLWWLLRHC